MIRLEKVSKTLGSRRRAPTLDELDLALDPGDVLLLSGASGSGKSTLLKLLYGDVIADRGTVRMFDRDVSRLRRSSLALLRQRVGIIPQEIRLLEGATARRNVSFPLEIQAASRRDLQDRTAWALDLVGLTKQADSSVQQLSGSERRRVMIARALVTGPAVVLADEPTSDLDSVRKDEFCSLVDEMRVRGTICIVTTNDSQVLGAAALCGWRHRELRSGALHEVEAIAVCLNHAPQANGRGEIAVEIDMDDSDNHITDGVPNVVPFPYALGGGGLE